MKQRSFLLLLSGIATALALTASAQTQVETEAFTAEFGRGSREIIISGSGASSKDLDDSLGGFHLSLGQFYSDTREVSLRQTINYSNPNNDDSAWNGSTKFAFDQHFGTARVRPFLGVNAGYVYGEGVRDTWAAGLEGGVKYYVQPRTFIVAMADYGWFFQKAENVDDRFDDGQFTWSLGVGFNF